MPPLLGLDLDVDIEALAAIARAHSIGLVAVFGSRARGQERPGSDLDLGALRRDARPMTLPEVRALALDLHHWARTEVDVVDLARADALLRFEVVASGHPLHEADPGTWKLFVARTLIDHDDIAAFLPALVAGVGRAARRTGGA